jgi:acetoin:2,6-dichlorophenolindophenol oxidoreductase subunit alpha
MDATASEAPQADADLRVRVDMYRMMMEARLFEKRAHDLFLEGLVKGTSHLAMGRRPSRPASPRPSDPTTSSTARIAGMSTPCSGARRWPPYWRN